MNKIIFLKGLPGSGKSTFAKQYIKDNPNFIRVNKDDIRAMFGYKLFNKKKEKFTVNCEYAMAKKALERGFSVIVDDTNFNPFHRDNYISLSAEFGVEFETITMDTPIEECIRRDSLREKPVGEKVIRDMAKKWGVV